MSVSVGKLGESGPIAESIRLGSKDLGEGATPAPERLSEGRRVPPETIAATTEGLIVRIHVQPGASKSEIRGLHGGRLRVRVRAKPVEGEANRAVCEILAKAAGVAKSRVEIVRGAASRDKDLLIRCDAPKETETVLGANLSSSLS